MCLHGSLAEKLFAHWQSHCTITTLLEHQETHSIPAETAIFMKCTFVKRDIIIYMYIHVAIKYRENNYAYCRSEKINNKNNNKW